MKKSQILDLEKIEITNTGMMAPAGGDLIEILDDELLEDINGGWLSLNYRCFGSGNA